MIFAAPALILPPERPAIIQPAQARPDFRRGLILPIFNPRPRVETLFDRTAGTNIGSMTGGGGLAGAFDGTTSQVYTAAANLAAVNGFVGKNLGTPSPASKLIFYPANGTSNVWWDINSPGHTVTLFYYGKATAPASGTDGTLLGQSASNFADGSTASVTVTSADLTTPYQYQWGYIVLSAGGNVVIAELQIYTMI